MKLKLSCLRSFEAEYYNTLVPIDSRKSLRRTKVWSIVWACLDVDLFENIILQIQDTFQKDNKLNGDSILANLNP